MSKYLDSAGLTRLWAKIKAMFAPLASPTFTGTPSAPTAAAGTNTTQVATTAFVKTAVDNAAVTVDDALSSTSENPVQNKVINSALALKAPLASPALTGNPTAPTQAAGNNSTRIATTAFVKTAIANAAPTVDTAMSDSSTNAVQNKVIKGYVDGKISTAYKAKGSLSSAGLSASLLVAANEGNVYNISEQFTTTSNFVEGAGKTYPAGTNVVIVNNSINTTPSYKFDVLAGMVDLSGYVTSSAMYEELAGRIPACVYLETNNQGRTPDDYQGDGPVYGEFFYCGLAQSDSDKKMYRYNGTTWAVYTGNKIFILEAAGGTTVGSDDDYELTASIIGYDTASASWVNILSLFPYIGDFSSLQDDVADTQQDVADLYSEKLNRAEQYFYYLDSAHQTTTAPSTSTAKTGQFYWNPNTSTMYRFNGTSWATYTGDGFFMLGGENQSSADKTSILYPNDIIYYNHEISQWGSFWSELTEQDSLLNNVIRPTGKTGIPLTTGHTLGQYYLYKSSVGSGANAVTTLTLYVGNSDGSATQVTSSDKLFLYDGMVYQYISGTGDGTGLQPVGHVESITDSEIDTICV